jgi:hypothetical protein
MPFCFLVCRVNPAWDSQPAAKAASGLTLYGTAEAVPYKYSPDTNCALWVAGLAATFRLAAKGL